MNEKYLKAYGLLSFDGQEVEGIKGRFQITKSGLQAAAHRQGASAVSQYLKWLEGRGWKSDPNMSGSNMSIETRLREFSNVPYD